MSAFLFTKEYFLYIFTHFTAQVGSLGSVTAAPVMHLQVVCFCESHVIQATGDVTVSVLGTALVLFFLDPS